MKDLLKELLQNGGKISSPNRAASLFYENNHFIVATMEFGTIYNGNDLENALRALDSYCFVDELSFETRAQYIRHLKSFNE